MRENDFLERVAYIEDLLGLHDQEMDSVYNSCSDGRRNIQISPLEGAILEVLVRSIGAKVVVEIGSLFGYSAIWMARGLESDGTVFSIDHSQDHCKIARQNYDAMGMGGRVTQLCGNGVESLRLVESNAPVDFLFIDADKGGYMSYLAWGEKHVRKGGMIVAHNVLLSNSVYSDFPERKISKRSSGVMKDFNAAVANRGKYSTVVLPIFDGMSISYKKI